ncbi:peptidoglycan editing factor PgeF [Thioalkalivibrio sp. ALJT]|uniref:peptidoglycan editing factor PgeF n=1 Tax=Thioalkalivibrio sp. ALJT TaxID=1158146 RepID=UPI00039B5056|nr:peptidoglycan editing factor PgeF [Thioalkalivibrio sp. ALJT]
MAEPLSLLVPPPAALPAPVRALQTTRRGGVSPAPWDTLNLALHTGDERARVAANRQRLEQELGLAQAVDWPRQVHGTQVVRAEDLQAAQAQGMTLEADAVVTDRPGVVCAVQTADCLPVVMATADGRAVGVAHAGWRGLVGGVLEATLEALHAGRPDAPVQAWMGASIGPGAFEVGPEVRAAFLEQDPGAGAAFVAAGAGRLLADLYQLARRRLERAGVRRVAGGGRCTFREAEHFFSYRRDGETGRMGTLVWIEPLQGDAD